MLCFKFSWTNDYAEFSTVGLLRDCYGENNRKSMKTEPLESHVTVFEVGLRSSG